MRVLTIETKFEEKLCTSMMFVLTEVHFLINHINRYLFFAENVETVESELFCSFVSKKSM